MKVFLSWAGDTSKGVALALRELLPSMLQGIEPFMSAHDINPGSRWAVRLAAELEHTNYGILCLTPTSLKSEWLLFEAGALAKLNESRACGLLHGVTVQDLTGPLSQFQHKPLDAGNFLVLLQDLNKLTTKPLEPSTVVRIHEKWWPDLEGLIQKVDKEPMAPSPKTTRPLPEILEELVTRVRNVERSVDLVRPRPASSAATVFMKQQRERLLKLSEGELATLVKCLDLPDEDRFEFLQNSDEAVVNSLVAQRLAIREGSSLKLASWVSGALRRLAREVNAPRNA